MKSKLLNLGFLLVEQLMCVRVYASPCTLDAVYTTQAISMPLAYFPLFLLLFCFCFLGKLWRKMRPYHIL